MQKYPDPAIKIAMCPHEVPQENIFTKEGKMMLHSQPGICSHLQSSFVSKVSNSY